jgi:hypothetical protein
MTIVSHPKRPIALFSYVDAEDTKRLLQATRDAKIPKNTPMYFGNYGVNPATGAKVHALPNGRYAPMFALDETAGRYRERNYLTPAEAKLLAKRPDARFAGAVPPRAKLAALSSEDRVRWGIELGKRMRDQIRQGNREGAKINAWQFDEILGECGQASQKPLRQFIRGVVEGLHSGRPELGDKPMKGITWFAHTALNLANGPLDAEEKRFFQTIDKASLRIVGEEYPNFAGDPRATARAWNDPQEWMAHSKNATLRNLSTKFVAGLSPGWALGVGLGGNVNGMSRAAVNHWRDEYIDQRKRDGVAGFAEYSFRRGNKAPNVFEDTARSIAKGVKR